MGDDNHTTHICCWGSAISGPVDAAVSEFVPMAISETSSQR
jgi:hypothetical protein